MFSRLVIWLVNTWGAYLCLLGNHDEVFRADNLSRGDGQICGQSKKYVCRRCGEVVREYLDVWE